MKKILFLILTFCISSCCGQKELHGWWGNLEEKEAQAQAPRFSTDQLMNLVEYWRTHPALVQILAGKSDAEVIQYLRTDVNMKGFRELPRLRELPFAFKTTITELDSINWTLENGFHFYRNAYKIYESNGGQFIEMHSGAGATIYRLYDPLFEDSYYEGWRTGKNGEREKIKEYVLLIDNNTILIKRGKYKRIIKDNYKDSAEGKQ